MSYAIENGNNKKRKNFISTKITHFYGLIHGKC